MIRLLAGGALGEGDHALEVEGAIGEVLGLGLCKKGNNEENRAGEQSHAANLWTGAARRKQEWGGAHLPREGSALETLASGRLSPDTIPEGLPKSVPS